MTDEENIGVKKEGIVPTRPVVGDVKCDYEMAQEWACQYLKIIETMGEDAGDIQQKNLAECFLATSDQLAAEQEKAKALQPYKDAYDGGKQVFSTSFDDALSGYVTAEKIGSFTTPVRVCKPVKGDG